jgi:hypothetical protein
LAKEIVEKLPFHVSSHNCVVSIDKKKNSGFIAASRASPWLLPGCVGVFPVRREILKMASSWTLSGNGSPQVFFLCFSATVPAFFGYLLVDKVH